MYTYLKALKVLSAGESHKRHVIHAWSMDICRSRTEPVILDIGAGRGEDILAVRDQIPGVRLNAVESFPISIESLQANGVIV